MLAWLACLRRAGVMRQGPSFSPGFVSVSGLLRLLCLACGACCTTGVILPALGRSGFFAMNVSAGTPVLVELPRDSTLELHSFSANTIFPYTRAIFKLMVQAGNQRPYELAHVDHTPNAVLAASARLSHKFAASDGPLNFTLAAITESPRDRTYPYYDLLQSISHDVVGYLTQHRPHHITIDDKDAPIAVQIQP